MFREKDILRDIERLHKSIEKVQADISSLAEKVERNNDNEAVLRKEIHEIKDVTAVKSDNLAQLNTIISEKQDKLANLIGTISEKQDNLIPYINNVNLKNHTSVYGIPGGITGIICDDFILGVPSEEWGLAMFLSLNGHFEKGTEALFERIIKPGMKVLDLGANVGMFSLRALRAGCEVFAFEPTPSTFSILRQNIKANGFEETGRAHLHQFAVADKAGIVRFYELPGVSGQNSMYGREGLTATEVEAVAIDQMEGLPEEFDVIKMDIEGAEYAAFLGMRNTLRRSRNVKMIMEFAPVHMKRADVDPQDIIKLIDDLGFQAYVIDEGDGSTKEADYSEIIKADSVNLYLEKTNDH